MKYITQLFLINISMYLAVFRAYRPSSLSTIKPINHRAYRPSSLLTLALLSRLLSLSACFFKASLREDIKIKKLQIW